MVLQKEMGYDISSISFIIYLIQKQLNSQTEELEQYNRFYGIYRIPEGISKIVNLPWGVYNLSENQFTQFEDDPKPIAGRGMIITTGNTSLDEKVAIVLKSNSNLIYYGHQYGNEFVWEAK